MSGHTLTRGGSRGGVVAVGLSGAGIAKMPSPSVSRAGMGSTAHGGRVVGCQGGQPVALVDPTATAAGATVCDLLLGGRRPDGCSEMVGVLTALLALHDAQHDPPSPHYAIAAVCGARPFDPMHDHAKMTQQQAIRAAFDSGVPASKAPAFVLERSGVTMTPAAVYQWYWRRRQQLARCGRSVEPSARLGVR